MFSQPLVRFIVHSFFVYPSIHYCFRSLICLLLNIESLNISFPIILYLFQKSGGKFSPNFNTALICDREDVRTELNNKASQLVDARKTEYFTGVRSHSESKHIRSFFSYLLILYSLKYMYSHYKISCLTQIL